MKNRSYTRDIIIKSLYQIFIYDSKNISYNIENIVKDLSNEIDYYTIDTITNILNKQKRLEQLANKYLNNWSVDRLGKIDKAIMLLAIYELKYTDTPKIVAINEAIELAKKYSDDKVVAMVNASLDKLYHDEVQDE